MKRENWIWMPHPGHFIGASRCRFHLNTYVGNYIVSTVGEYWPESEVREILAKSRNVVLEGKGDNRDYDYMKKLGFEDIGLERKYETMVFKAQRSKLNACCPWEMMSASSVDMKGYNDPFVATRGHLALCLKWSKK